MFFTQKMVDIASFMVAGHGIMSKLTLQTLTEALSFASSRTMVIEAAVRWARSDCTSPIERLKRARHTDETRLRGK